MILKNGIDITSIERIQKIYNKYGDIFLNRIFTKAEILTLKKNDNFNINKIAKRFSAKEAFSKALGVGIGKISFKDIEVFSNEKKEPYIQVSQNIATFFQERNWHNVHICLSLSDDANVAIANVIIYIN